MLRKVWRYLWTPRRISRRTAIYWVVLLYIMLVINWGIIFYNLYRLGTKP